MYRLLVGLASGNRCLAMEVQMELIRRWFRRANDDADYRRGISCALDQLAQDRLRQLELARNPRFHAGYRAALSQVSVVLQTSEAGLLVIDREVHRGQG